MQILSVKNDLFRHILMVMDIYMKMIIIKIGNRIQEDVNEDMAGESVSAGGNMGRVRS